MPNTLAPQTSTQAHEASLHVNGERIVAGDATSVSVLFGNLDGRNFAKAEPWRTQTFGDWLGMARKEWGADLPLGAVVTTRDATGRETGRSTIGAGAPAAAQQVSTAS